MTTPSVGAIFDPDRGASLDGREELPTPIAAALLAGRSDLGAGCWLELERKLTDEYIDEEDGASGSSVRDRRFVKFEGGRRGGPFGRF